MYKKYNQWCWEVDISMLMYFLRWKYTSIVFQLISSWQKSKKNFGFILEILTDSLTWKKESEGQGTPSVQVTPKEYGKKTFLIIVQNTSRHKETFKFGSYLLFNLMTGTELSTDQKWVLEKSMSELSLKFEKVSKIESLGLKF